MTSLHLIYIPLNILWFLLFMFVFRYPETLEPSAFPNTLDISRKLEPVTADVMLSTHHLIFNCYYTYRVHVEKMTVV